MSHCTVYAITNQKGGVGKTTTTVNLGIGLAKAGKKVLLIDFDPQASLTASLGYKQPDELDDTISTVLEHSISDKPMARNYAILHHDEGVDFIPSNIELSELEVRLINTMSREQALREYLDCVKENYDYILIDCMPSLGVITINALVAADRVIIPTQPNYLSAKGLDLLAQSIRRVQRRLNPQLEIAGTLFTMVDNRTNHARSVIEALRSGSLPVFDTEIPDREKLARLLSISPEQMSYITDVEPGCGLIKYGSTLVPFVNKFPKDTKLYELMTTKPGEGVFAGASNDDKQQKGVRHESEEVG